MVVQRPQNLWRGDDLGPGPERAAYCRAGARIGEDGRRRFVGFKGNGLGDAVPHHGVLECRIEEPLHRNPLPSAQAKRLAHGRRQRVRGNVRDASLSHLAEVGAQRGVPNRVRHRCVVLAAGANGIVARQVSPEEQRSQYQRLARCVHDQCPLGSSCCPVYCHRLPCVRSLAHFNRITPLAPRLGTMAGGSGARRIGHIGFTPCVTMAISEEPSCCCVS